MNKKLFMSALAVLVVVSMSGVSYANDGCTDSNKPMPPMEQKRPDFKGPHQKQFKNHRPSKEEMEAKKAEFEKRLNLTEEQKQQIEKNKQKDREKMKPIMQKMHEKKKALHEIKMDKSLSPEDKLKKSAEHEKDLIDLKVKANDLRKKNMESFEKILTPEQKTEFEKIKEEQKQEMEKRRPPFHGGKGFHRPHPPIEKPVVPEPAPVKE